MKKVKVAFVLFCAFAVMKSFGFSNTVVIEDMFGNKMTECSGFSCDATVSGSLNGYSDFDSFNGSTIMPEIDHLDGSKTECLGMFCERSN